METTIMLVFGNPGTNGVMEPVLIMPHSEEARKALKTNGRNGACPVTGNSIEELAKKAEVIMNGHVSIVKDGACLVSNEAKEILTKRLGGFAACAITPIF